MKLLVLLVLCGLVSVTSAQADSRKFLILDDETDSDDLNVTEIETMQESEDPNTNPAMVMKGMEKGNMTFMRSDLGSKTVDSMFNSEETGRVMFPTSSVLTNEEVNNTASSASIERTLPFHCPYKSYRLRWFPHKIGYVKHICFVPWAWNQDIVYAKCINSNCHWFSTYEGCCRPSCHSPRVIAALCFNPCSPSWTWRIVVRNLPSACVCSSCFSFQRYRHSQN